VHFAGIPFLFLRLQNLGRRKDTLNTGGFYEKEIINFNVYGHIVSGVFACPGHFGDNCGSVCHYENLSSTNKCADRTP